MISLKVDSTNADEMRHTGEYMDLESLFVAYFCQEGYDNHFHASIDNQSRKGKVNGYKSWKARPILDQEAGTSIR